MFFPKSALGHTLPQAPQWLTLLSTRVSHPSASGPSVVTVPPLQLRHGSLQAWVQVLLAQPAVVFGCA